MEMTKITIDLADVTGFLCGVQELAEGMSDGIYNSTTEGVLRENTNFTEGQNARDFVYKNYELTAGAFRMIAAGMGIITAAIANDELDIIGKGSG